MILVASVPAIVVGIRTIGINRVGMQDAILELHTTLAESIAEKISFHLTSIDKEIGIVTASLRANIDWTDRHGILQALLDTNPSLVTISFLDKNGREILKAYNPDLETVPSLINYNQSPLYKRYVEIRQPVMAVDESSGAVPTISKIFPLTAEHSLFVKVSLQKLDAEISKIGFAKTGVVFVVDETGRLILPSGMERKILPPGAQVSLKDMDIVKKSLAADAVGSSEYMTPLGKLAVGAFSSVKNVGWGVVVQQDKDEAYISVYKMKQSTIILTVISVLIASMVSFFLARGLLLPLSRLNSAAKKISARNFDVAGELSRIKTKDEIEDLAKTFGETAEELKKYDEMQVDKIVSEKTKMDAVIFSISDAILMTDTEGKIQLYNRSAKKILGLPDENVLNRPVWEFVKDEKIKTTFLEMLKNPHGATREVEVAAGGNIINYYKASSSMVEHPQKKSLIGVVTVMRDITLEKEIDHMKETFLHSITHDLRNPMTSIRGFLKFLRDGVGGPVTDQQKKMLDTMDRSSQKLLAMINDILDIAKLESGKMQLNLSEANIVQTAKNAAASLEAMIAKKKINFSITSDETAANENFMFDASLIERVIMNLLSNAVKFTHEGGTITVEISGQQVADSGRQVAGSEFPTANRQPPTAGSILVSVIDTGEGIPPEYVNVIFDKFQQVAGQKKGGTGLGLTICKNIVEAHGGKIWVESVFGKGSTFTFILPFKKENGERLSAASINKTNGKDG